MYAPIPVLVVVGFQCRQDSKFNPGSIAVFLDRPNDLDSNLLISLPVSSLHYLSEGPLTEKFVNLICVTVSYTNISLKRPILTSLSQVRIRHHNIVPIVVVDLAILCVRVLLDWLSTLR